MTRNTVYMVRHGENIANVTHEFSCRNIDYSLTEKGIAQAEQTAAYFATHPIDAIYASPLKRAAETATIIARPLGLPVQVLDGFREVNVGELEGQPTPENWALHDRIFDRWLHAGEAEAAFPGGETQTQLIARMRDALATALCERDGQRIVIVAHGGVLVASIAALCPGIRYADLEPAWVQNCAITEVEIELSDGRCSGALRGWALASHLAVTASA